MTLEEFREARKIIAAATPAKDAEGNEYYLGGIPFTDTTSGKTVHRMVKYTAERFAEHARIGWASALDEIEYLRNVLDAAYEADPCIFDHKKVWER